MAAGIQQTAVMEEPSIEQRISALPQELRDIIFDFTVAIKPGQTVALVDTGSGAGRNATWQLQINHALRKELAPVYFGTNSFLAKMLIYPRTPERGPPSLAKWLAAQTASHSAMIKDIRLEIEDHNDKWRNMLKERSHGDIGRLFIADGTTADLQPSAKASSNCRKSPWSRSRWFSSIVASGRKAGQTRNISIL